MGINFGKTVMTKIVSKPEVARDPETINSLDLYRITNTSLKYSVRPVYGHMGLRVVPDPRDLIREYVAYIHKRLGTVRVMLSLARFYFSTNPIH